MGIRGVGRRSLLVGGAALLVGAGLVRSAPASAVEPSGTPAGEPFGLTPAQQAGQRVIWSYPGLTPPPAQTAISPRRADRARARRGFPSTHRVSKVDAEAGRRPYAGTGAR